jgi:hypothetical protein
MVRGGRGRVGVNYATSTLGDGQNSCFFSISFHLFILFIFSLVTTLKGCRTKIKNKWEITYLFTSTAKEYTECQAFSPVVPIGSPPRSLTHKRVLSPPPLVWPTAPSYVCPNVEGVGGMRGLSQWVQLCTWSPNKLIPYLTSYGIIPLRLYHLHLLFFKILLSVWQVQALPILASRRWQGKSHFCNDSKKHPYSLRILGQCSRECQEKNIRHNTIPYGGALYSFR